MLMHEIRGKFRRRFVCGKFVERDDQQLHYLQKIPSEFSVDSATVDHPILRIFHVLIGIQQVFFQFIFRCRFFFFLIFLEVPSIERTIRSDEWIHLDTLRNKRGIFIDGTMGVAKVIFLSLTRESLYMKLKRLAEYEHIEI